MENTNELLKYLLLTYLLYTGIRVVIPYFLTSLTKSAITSSSALFRRLTSVPLFKSQFEKETKAIYEDLRMGESELIVSTQKFGLVEKLESSKIKFGIPLGSSIAVYTGENCVCQHIISLHEVEIKELRKDRIVLVIPLPKLNKNTIELDISAEIEVRVGLFRLSAYSGESLKRELRRHLRKSALKKLEEDKNSFQLVAKMFARRKVEELIKGKYGFKFVDITFKDEVEIRESNKLLKFAI